MGLHGTNTKVVKKWLANITEIVHYLHRIGIVHRNLKPGSFYLKPMPTEENICLVLGDFCVLSIAKDVRTKTRISQDAFDYTAPEVRDGKSFTYKSDIWSIGAIFIDVCSTSIMEVKIILLWMLSLRLFEILFIQDKKLHSNLVNLKHDEELKYELMDMIYEVCTSN